MVDALERRTGAKVIGTAGARETVLKHQGVTETADVTPRFASRCWIVSCARPAPNSG